MQTHPLLNHGNFVQTGLPKRISRQSLQLMEPGVHLRIHHSTLFIPNKSARFHPLRESNKSGWHQISPTRAGVGGAITCKLGNPVPAPTIFFEAWFDGGNI
jgi:hypothetical protein